MIQVKKHIAAMSAYSPPWTGLDRTRYLRFDLNENTQPLPEHVRAALKKLADENTLQMYPNYADFMPKLGQFLQQDPDNLIITNGSDQAIDILLRAFLEQDDAMLIARPEFPIFAQFAQVMNVAIQGVPFNPDMSFPFESFSKAVTEQTKLIVIINPNNPTGSVVSIEQIKQILTDHPNIPVIVDEAYYEFTGLTCQDLLEEHENLIITRTFSKAFAMAGLRLGYIIASKKLISEFYKIRAPFDINSCAIKAAEAQIDHQDEWQAYVREVMNQSKPLLERFFNENSVFYYPGAANFMLVRPPKRDEAVAYLKEKGILVRPMVAPAINDTFRISIGTVEEIKRFIDVYRSYLMLNAL